MRSGLILLILLVGIPAFAEDPEGSFDVRFRLALDPLENEPVEGEMMLATLRGEYRETVTNEEIKLRRMTDFDWIQLAPDRWSEQRIDGLPTVVVERRIALFPRRSGTLTILPVAHELELVNSSGERQRVLVRTEPVEMDIAAKPSGSGSGWLPVRALEISETWTGDPSVLEDGENIERRVVLRALGVPPESLPEQPPMREPWLITFTPPEERSVQITTEGPVSTVVWVWKLRPITGAPGVIPEVAIPYFDTSDRRTKSAVIPSSTIGYASFADNASIGWQPGFRMGTPLAVSFLCGLVLATLALLRRARFSRTPVTRMVSWFARYRRLLELRRLEHQGNIPGFRERMADFLKSETTLGEDDRLRFTGDLDEIVFSTAPGSGDDQMAEARRALRKI